MNCARNFELTDYAFGELEPEALRAAELHVSECVKCRNEVAPIRAIRERLGALPEVDPSPDFASQVRRKFLAENPEFGKTPSNVTSFRMPLWSWSMLAHAAVFLILATAFYMYFPRRQKPAEPAGPQTPGPTKPRDGVKTPPPTPIVDEPLEALLTKWREKLAKEQFKEILVLRGDAAHRESLRNLMNAARTSGAVARALAFLASKQTEEGRWEGVEQTSLALLAFLAEGHTSVSGDYRELVFHGMAWLVKQQREDGSIGATVRDHALATLALQEASMMDVDERFRSAAQAAIGNLIGRAPGAEPVETAWMIQPLRLALVAGNETVVPALKKLHDALARAVGKDPAQAAAILYGRLLASPVYDWKMAFRQGGQILDGAKAQIKGPDIDFAFLYYGSHGAYQLGGDVWNDWNLAGNELLLSFQSAEGAWAKGDVTKTALATLALEALHRYPQFAQ